MKRSRWDLSIDVVIYRGIFKNNQITPPVLPSYLQGLILQLSFVPIVTNLMRATAIGSKH